ncbi:sugar ABC transporter permease [Paenibacillus doosanensis]|uniref:Lactose transport system permease protein LacF n=1 Tax=Paenibacillus konkukensis TaxID=2020716 RepID=A0ABY4RUV2_9BACL|nr:MULTISPECIES: sugar ABC transporter permease [Paenibacillus]MCS7464209.1 sugar ABC transporter permease [Paenibacillus doosanensis]UQZ85600.1 Lactose transport system permease protein LacF [Paenibacillus konkukensis]
MNDIKAQRITPYLFLFPAMLGLLLFKLYPVFKGLTDSLYAPAFLNASEAFVGLQNYTTLFTDPVFWNSLKITLLFNVFVNPIQVILAFMLALLLNAKLKHIGIFRGIHFVPVAVSVSTACILWNIMLSPEQGVVNSMLVGLGLEQQPFLTSSKQALASIIGISTWKGIGYWAIFFLAGLQEVSVSLYEASSMDGASRWQQFMQVTFPMMKRSITFVAVSVTVSNFLLFSPMYILTQGGPEHSTNVLMLESYNSAFLYSDSGRASAIVIILLLLTLSIVALQFKFLKAKH